ncbi:hypothetical protein [Nibrella viscosa]
MQATLGSPADEIKSAETAFSTEETGKQYPEILFRTIMYKRY